MIEKLACRLPFFYGWIVVGVVFVTMAICFNARTAFSLLFPPILDELGWERGVTVERDAPRAAIVRGAQRLARRWQPRSGAPRPSGVRLVPGRIRAARA